MSRLDDELKFALRRVEPSVDFADRVMERIAGSETSKPTVWQKLLAFFQPQPFRWIAATAAAALLIAAGLWLYPQIGKKNIDSPGLQAAVPPAPESVPDQPKLASGDDQRETLIPSPVKSQTSPKANRRVQPVRYQKEKVEKTEGEIAKERLMLALQIASAKLNEAQKIVQNED